MRRIIVLSYMSLDGFISTPDGKTDWIVWDDDVDDYYMETQDSADALIFGRATFETMKNYWGTSKSAAEKPEIIEFMNETKKIGFFQKSEKSRLDKFRIVRRNRSRRNRKTEAAIRQRHRDLRQRERRRAVHECGFN